MDLSRTNSCDRNNEDIPKGSLNSKEDGNEKELNQNDEEMSIDRKITKQFKRDGIILGSLHIAELDVNVDEKILYDHFKDIEGCKIKSVKIVRNKITNESLGYGYINFENEYQASIALEEKNFSKILGHVIRISYTKEKSLVQLSKNRINTNKSNLYIKNLHESIDSRLLYISFRDYGPIISARVIENRYGKSKGYGFVCFEKESDALYAIKMMDNSELKGKRIHVSVAQCNNLYYHNNDNNILTEEVNHKSSLRKQKKYHYHSIYNSNRIYPAHQLFGLYYVPITTENDYSSMNIQQSLMNIHTINHFSLPPFYKQYGDLNY